MRDRRRWEDTFPHPPQRVAARVTGLYRERAEFLAHRETLLQVARDFAAEADPDVVLDGIPETDVNGRDMLDLVLEAVDATLRSVPPKRRLDQDKIEDMVKKTVRSTIDAAWGKRPIVKVMTATVEG